MKPMSPKEKAEELVYRFKNDKYLQWGLNIYLSKKCALIAVDEILKNEFYETEYEPYYVDKEKSKLITFKEYWQEVKNELEEQ
jgi:hypothetical protein